MADRKPFIAGNWKMYKTGPEAAELAEELKKLVCDVNGVDIMIAPPFTALGTVYEIIKGSNIQLGGQNLFWKTEGAYTGEISPSMLRSAGCSYVIIGHSERRQHFGETDETISKKIRAALDAELKPILCIGESLEERESNQTYSVLDNQLERCLQGLTSDDIHNLTIAYEPVWAIGTGKTATRDQVQGAHSHIRKRLKEKFGILVEKSLRILYGGSVKPENIKGLMSMPDVDGALVGGASLKAESFAGIIRFND
nr:triose-phosphate isomerase [Desulfobacterales bacterium]